MFFLKGRRRRRLLQTPLADADRELMHRLAPLTAALPADLRPAHEGAVQVLLAEKHFEGAAGLAVTREMELIVAGLAALLQLRPDADWYPGLDTVLIYPEAFVVDHGVEDEHGFVHEGEDELAGESWQRGVVILSWQDVVREAEAHDGYNVVLHEFAHQLDERTGEADGMPLLADPALAARWNEAFAAAFARHRKLCKRRREVLFDQDAAESPAEFLATAVELFFEYPRDLKAEYQDVHALLAAWLHLDPAAWTAG
ncbi:MAG: zinc-dependent peptidase [Krumholzibacteria bacterium]|nr:zinc-dependent peptidase [Candidatus Krumholzibacteria bacterium]